jgi:hypothetical protein
VDDFVIVPELIGLAGSTQFEQRKDDRVLVVGVMA